MTEIRKLQTKDDLSELVALSRSFFAEYEAHHDAFFEIDELRDADITGYFSRSLDTNDGATFIAIQDGAIQNGGIVGYITVFVRGQASFYKVKQVGAISGLMVHPDHRRKGIGSQLLAKATAFFQEKGVTYFTVYTAAANRAAVQFYERNNMSPLHVTLIGKTSYQDY
jgi:ribosomal protein S18 acetylase RimI-like enzyme